METNTVLLVIGLVLQSIVIFGSLAIGYGKIKSKIEVVETDIRWIKKSLFGKTDN